MVNLLLISHSKKLAEGTADMIQQMVSSDQVKIATAAGVGEDNQELGTNAVEIAETIEKIYSEDGVLILMDLGSALLSAEMALDIIPEEMKAKIKMCPAPFVEGALAAGVQASLGTSLESVYNEAMHALKAKRDQLSAPDQLEISEPTPVQTEQKDDNIRETTLVLGNPAGLHARPAVLFVKAISSFDAKVLVKNLTENKGPVPGNSLISVLSLGGRKGNEIHISAEGPQRNEVIEALIELANNNFGESA